MIFEGGPEELAFFERLEIVPLDKVLPRRTAACVRAELEDAKEKRARFDETKELANSWLVAARQAVASSSTRLEEAEAKLEVVELKERKRGELLEQKNDLKEREVKQAMSDAEVVAMVLAALPTPTRTPPEAPSVVGDSNDDDEESLELEHIEVAQSPLEVLAEEVAELLQQMSSTVPRGTNCAVAVGSPPVSARVALPRGTPCPLECMQLEPCTPASALGRPVPERTPPKLKESSSGGQYGGEPQAAETVPRERRECLAAKLSRFTSLYRSAVYDGVLDEATADAVRRCLGVMEGRLDEVGTSTRLFRPVDGVRCELVASLLQSPPQRCGHESSLHPRSLHH